MIRIFNRRWLSSIALLGAVAVGSADVRAGFTEVKNSHSPRNAKEASHEQILERVYGGNFVADGVNFSNGSLTVTRLADTGAGQTDAAWSGEVVSARAVAAFAKRKQSFGYFGGSDGGGQFNKLFDVSGNSFDVEGGATAPSNLDGAIRFGRNENVGRAFSSLAADNRDGKDHLVSYRITSDDSQSNPLYLLFWEDKWGKRSDFDFNDLVIEVTAAGSPVLVPLPPAAWSGLGGLAALGVLTGWKRARRWIF